ncbi:MAG: hypothetical protein ACXQTN_03090 [Methanoculleaceae archaeon]
MKIEDSSWRGILPEPRATCGACRQARTPSAPHPLYCRYRDIALSEDDRRWLVGQNLRFEISVIPSGIVGGHRRPGGQYYYQLPQQYLCGADAGGALAICNGKPIIVDVTGMLR